MYTSSKPYFYGTGRRKKSVARVRIVPGSGAITVNGRSKTYSESAPVSELIIKNNRFCGMGARPDILTATGCYNPKNKIIHGKIVIESNEFTSCDGGYIALKYFDTVIIKNNTFKQNPSYVPRWQKAHIQTNYCNTITVD